MVTSCPGGWGWPTVISVTLAGPDWVMAISPARAGQARAAWADGAVVQVWAARRGRGAAERRSLARPAELLSVRVMSSALVLPARAPGSPGRGAASGPDPARRGADARRLVVQRPRHATCAVLAWPPRPRGAAPPLRMAAGCRRGPAHALVRAPAQARAGVVARPPASGAAARRWLQRPVHG